MKFTKMHGISNDYVYVNCFEESVPNPGKVAQFISDRHRGIGSDGLVLIMPSSSCDFRMRMFNADGSEAEMCGNASRCVGKYVYDNGLTTKTSLSLETKAGLRLLSLHLGADGKVASVTVDMGKPELTPALIPVSSKLTAFIDQPVKVLDQTYYMTAVSMGNPHAVVFTKNIDNIPLQKVGPLCESLSIFPNKTNTEFVEVLDAGHLKMRVWERGAGETMACGTGACAVAVAASLNGFTGRQVKVFLKGGTLDIVWNEADNHVLMTGEATTVFTGSIQI